MVLTRLRYLRALRNVDLRARLLQATFLCASARALAECRLVVRGVRRRERPSTMPRVMDCKRPHLHAPLFHSRPSSTNTCAARNFPQIVPSTATRASSVSRLVPLAMLTSPVSDGTFRTSKHDIFTSTSSTLCIFRTRCQIPSSRELQVSSSTIFLKQFPLRNGCPWCVLQRVSSAPLGPHYTFSDGTQVHQTSTHWPGNVFWTSWHWQALLFLSAVQQNVQRFNVKVVLPADTVPALAFSFGFAQTGLQIPRSRLVQRARSAELCACSRRRHLPWSRCPRLSLSLFFGRWDHVGGPGGHLTLQRGDCDETKKTDVYHRKTTCPWYDCHITKKRQDRDIKTTAQIQCLPPASTCSDVST